MLQENSILRSLFTDEIIGGLIDGLSDEEMNVVTQRCQSFVDDLRKGLVKTPQMLEFWRSLGEFLAERLGRDHMAVVWTTRAPRLFMLEY